MSNEYFCAICVKLGIGLQTRHYPCSWTVFTARQYGREVEHV